MEEDKEMSKKFVSKSVAIALGMACVILAVGVLGMFLKANQLESSYSALYDKYTDLSSKYNQLSSQYNQLKQKYNTLNAEYNELSSNYTELLSKYNQLKTEYNNLKNGDYAQLLTKYNQLKSEYNNYKSDHTYSNEEYQKLQADYNQLKQKYNTLNAEYAQLDNQYKGLENKYSELQSIVNLQKAEYLVFDETVNEPAGEGVYWNFTVPYAGYIIVDVETSSSKYTYVEVTYSAYGVNYDEKINVGSGGCAYFPVLPCDDLQVIVGNNNFWSGATETVTIEYVY